MTDRPTDLETLCRLQHDQIAALEYEIRMMEQDRVLAAQHREGLAAKLAVATHAAHRLRSHLKMEKQKVRYLEAKPGHVRMHREAGDEV